MTMEKFEKQNRLAVHLHNKSFDLNGENKTSTCSIGRNRSAIINYMTLSSFWKRDNQNIMIFKTRALWSDLIYFLFW